MASKEVDSESSGDSSEEELRQSISERMFD